MKKKIFVLHLIPDKDVDVEDLSNFLLKIIDGEEKIDKLTADEFYGHTITEIVDDEETQREMQSKGVHIGYSFPVTISKIDVSDFMKGKRDTLKKIFLICSED